MAGKTGRPPAHLKTENEAGSKWDLKRDLLKQGHAFSFFQVMRLVNLLAGMGKRAQEGGPAEKRNVRIRPELSLTFPPADVSKVEEKEGEDGSFFRITANFMGLYGISSPLPTFYTEDLLNEASEDRSVSREFIDIINHRLYELFYQCMTKYRQSIQVVEEGNRDHIQRLFSLVGLGEDALRADIPDPYLLLRYIGLFTQFPRSAIGLKTLLQDALGDVPVDLIPCIKRKVKIPEDQRICMGKNGGVLGESSFLGETIEDRNGKFRLSIGPMSRIDFKRCSPENDGYKKIVLLTNLYMITPLEYDIELILRKGEKKTICLGDEEWASLGVSTWIFSDEDRWESRRVVHPAKGI